MVFGIYLERLNKKKSNSVPPVISIYQSIAFTLEKFLKNHKDNTCVE